MEKKYWTFADYYLSDAEFNTKEEVMTHLIEDYFDLSDFDAEFGSDKLVELVEFYYDQEGNKIIHGTLPFTVSVVDLYEERA